MLPWPGWLGLHPPKYVSDVLFIMIIEISGGLRGYWGLWGVRGIRRAPGGCGGTGGTSYVLGTEQDISAS